MAGKRKMTPPSAEEMTEIAERQAAVLDAFDEFDGEVIIKELEGTWKKEVGAIIAGTISHAYEFIPKRKPGEPEKAPVPGLALVLTSPCFGRSDSGVVEFYPGDLVGVTLDTKLTQLLQYDVGGKVAIRVDGQADLSNGGHCWRYSVKVVGPKRRGAHPLKPLATVTETSDADETGAPEVDDSDFIE